MAAFDTIPPWLAVSPDLFLSATERGAGIGAQIAHANAQTAAESARLQASQQEAIMRMQAQQQAAAQRAAEYQGGLDLDTQKLLQNRDIASARLGQQSQEAAADQYLRELIAQQNSTRAQQALGERTAHDIAMEKKPLAPHTFGSAATGYFQLMPDGTPKPLIPAKAPTSGIGYLAALHQASLADEALAKAKGQLAASPDNDDLKTRFAGAKSAKDAAYLSLKNITNQPSITSPSTNAPASGAQWRYNPDTGQLDQIGSPQEQDNQEEE